MKYSTRMEETLNNKETGKGFTEKIIHALLT